MQLLLIVGLPGSGKTTLAKSIENCIVVDDITDKTQLPLPSDVIHCNIAVIDVNFCDQTILQTAKQQLTDMYTQHTIEVVYFENSPKKCLINVDHRKDGRNVIGTINRFTNIYQPPLPRQIWQPSTDKDTNAARVKI